MYNLQCNPHDHHHANIMVITIKTQPPVNGHYHTYQTHGHDHAIRNHFCDGSARTVSW